MRIIRKGLLEIEVNLESEDFANLEKQEVIGTRYDGEHKIQVHKVFPFHDLDSRQESFKQRERAEVDRETLDIDVYIPHAVLRDARVGASNFSLGLGNLEILPDSSGFNEIVKIRVEYSGSLQVVDVYQLYDSVEVG